jgi:23S rRNA G2069 N7-methylase RlmK/C1962 C5-methylase RlmI
MPPFDAPVPSQVVLDLLARADLLAAAASEAIVAGDDDRLAALLDDRDVVIGAVVDVWKDAAVHQHTPAQIERMTQATRATLAAAGRTHATAVIARDQVVGELSALDARQHASQEYGAVTSHRSIDVVL